VVTKLAEAGGCVTVQTIKEQLLYEVHDPSAYLTPDVTADFSGARIADLEQDASIKSGFRFLCIGWQIGSVGLGKGVK